MNLVIIPKDLMLNRLTLLLTVLQAKLGLIIMDAMSGGHKRTGLGGLELLDGDALIQEGPRYPWNVTVFRTTEAMVILPKTTHPPHIPKPTWKFSEKVARYELTGRKSGN